MNKRYIVRLTEGERMALGRLISKSKAAVQEAEAGDADALNHPGLG